ncbi:MAG: hypothetical protein VXV74_02915, partial [Pseudomonadota bacterium]|nr:hypothetical protein [Pseudomonadota bacterium]
MGMNQKDKALISADILENKSYDEPSVFQPKNLLRESRRQNGIPLGKVPRICILDPDGNLLDYLKNKNKALLNKFWACYHSNLYTSEIAGSTVGIIPRAVGASYAVLVAEQLFVSGCELLISITSAGIITNLPSDKKFTLITEAIRDEGTSYHYITKNERALLSPKLMLKLKNNKDLFQLFKIKEDINHINNKEFSYRDDINYLRELLMFENLTSNPSKV